MTRLNRMALSLAAVAVLILSAFPVHGATSNVIDVITVDAVITPPIASYIERNIAEAKASGASALVILLDTPGGLDLAMRDIVKSIMGSSVPVIVYVHPSGARAASAGAIITIAAHVAAMAPGTNIGAAHPVSIGAGKPDETMNRKVENDAAAYGIGIARQMGRSAEWIERAIRRSESIPADEALKLGAIDYVAPSLESLLAQIDGRRVKLAKGETVLATKNATINLKKMGVREKVLKTITDPNIAYILLLVGLAGLYFEFSTPGVIIPGVIGGISLILAFFALETLSVNFAGVLLILLAVIFFVAEIMVISHGALTIGGIISLVLGSVMLYDYPDASIRISLSVLIPTVIVISIFFVSIILLAIKAQRRKPRTGSEGMVGATGVALTDIAKNGRVMIQGEYWNAESVLPIDEGKSVRVVALKGLVLVVEEMKE